MRLIVRHMPCISHPMTLSRGAQTFCAKGRIGKNFEAEGRTDWKSKMKKVITTADVLFSTQNQVQSKKEKGHHVRRCLIFRSKSSEEQKKYKKSSRPQMSYILRNISGEQGLYFCKCPRAA